MIGMYKYFIMIHSVVNDKLQDLNFDDIDKIMCSSKVNKSYRDLRISALINKSSIMNN